MKQRFFGLFNYYIGKWMRLAKPGTDEVGVGVYNTGRIERFPDRPRAAREADRRGYTHMCGPRPFYVVTKKKTGVIVHETRINETTSVNSWPTREAFALADLLGRDVVITIRAVKK